MDIVSSPARNIEQTGLTRWIEAPRTSFISPGETVDVKETVSYDPYHIV
jgi:hypothetical protein